MSRIHAYFSRLPVHPEQGRLHAVRLTPSGQDDLEQLLSRPSTAWRGGLLLGRHTGAVLEIYFAVPGTTAPWSLPTGPLDLDPPYVFGWAAALQRTAPDLDWTGMWLVRPATDQTEGPDQTLAWLQSAYDKCLISNVRPLLIITERTRALVWDPVQSTAREVELLQR